MTITIFPMDAIVKTSVESPKRTYFFFSFQTTERARFRGWKQLIPAIFTNQLLTINDEDRPI